MNNTKFGLLQGALMFMPVFTPVLGGLAVERTGVQWMATLATFFAWQGVMLAAVGLSLSGYWMMMMGWIVFGLGSGLLTTTLEVFLIKATKMDRSLAIGLFYSIGKIISFAGTSLAVPLRERFESTSLVFWLGAHACGISMIFSLAMPSPPHRPKRVNLPNWPEYLSLSLYLYLGLGFLLAGSWIPFLLLSSNLLAVLIPELSHAEAAWIASSVYGLAILFTLISGILLNRKFFKPSQYRGCVGDV